MMFIMFLVGAERWLPSQSWCGIQEERREGGREGEREMCGYVCDTGGANRGREKC